ncbi:MAG: HEPN domain-containing protein [Gemmataceae bacterium]|nr:HEPN domain-containing protein [Gemmataceae bacterium]
MKPRDFLDVADALITGMGEAEWRSAVSRGYYAAFHAARALLRQCGFEVPQGEQVHGYLWLRLSNSGHPDVQKAGTDLKLLRQERNWADYDLDRERTHATAVGYVEHAEAIFDLLQLAANEPSVCGRITETMKVYERDVLRAVTWHG